MAESATPARLRLPWTGEFSPGQLGERALDETLAIVSANSGDRDAIVEAIRVRWFAGSAELRSDPAEQLKQQRTRAGNVLNGMQSYGLVDKAYVLTELGVELLAQPGPTRRHERFAEFLLKHRRGLELLDAARELHERGVRVTKTEVTDTLRRRGFWFTTNSADAGKLRQWLALAGVVTDKWVVSDERLAAVAGLRLATLAEWQSLTRPQQAFLQTLRRICEVRGPGQIPSPELVDFVLEEHGRVFDESQVRKIYAALSDQGWITHVVKPSGRGGKGGLIAPTAKLLETDFETLVGFASGELPADLRAVLNTPRDDIYRDLKSEDTHIKGIALELLAVHLASDLGLMPLRLRIRGVRTGGAEVDLVAEAASLQFARWLFQCKNTRTVTLSVLAKEVGVAALLQANVIVIATTGKFLPTASAFAKRVTETTPLQVCLVDGQLLSAYHQRGAQALRDFFRREAQGAMRLKRSQVLETLDEVAEDES